MKSESRKGGIECGICKDIVETTDLRLSPDQIAKKHGWVFCYIEEKSFGFYVCKNCFLKIYK